MGNTVKNFTDLTVYQKAHSLVLKIYSITNNFPSEEKFCLTDQIRRSAISVTSNIAEGFSKNSAKDKSQFYAISKGSLTELQSQMLVAKDLKYVTAEKFQNLESDFTNIAKMLSGLIKSAHNNF